jgi:hypothetical protein
MKHALFIAFHYPPESSSSGVLRTLKYTRYLARFGWRVTVLTVDRDAYEQTDPKLEEQVPENVLVIRTIHRGQATPCYSRSYPSFLAIPDRWVGWWPWAVAAGRQVVRNDPVDVMYSTTRPPTSSH